MNNKKKSQDLDKDIKEAQELVGLPFKDRLKYCLGQPIEFTRAVTMTLSILWLLTLPFVKYSIILLAISNAFWVSCCLSLAVYFAFAAIKNDPENSTLVSKTAAWLLMIAYCLGLIWIFSGYVRGPREAKINQEPASGVTYILYSKTCPFCQKAKKGMKTAATLYNYCPINQPAEYVDIDKDTKLANALRKHVKYKATVVKLDNGKYKTAIYGVKNKAGKAQAVSAGYAYQKLLEVR